MQPEEQKNTQISGRLVLEIGTFLINCFDGSCCKDDNSLVWKQVRSPSIFENSNTKFKLENEFY
jgi:hypothetical protein